MRFFVFLFFLFSCKNTIPVDGNNVVVSNSGLKNTTVLDKKDRPYVLNKKIIIPENHSFVVKNGVTVVLKKKGEILNYGSLFLGERIGLDSVFSRFLNNSHYILCKKNVDFIDFFDD